MRQFLLLNHFTVSAGEDETLSTVITSGRSMKLLGDITAYSPYYDEYETESWADQDGFQRALVIREDYPSVVWWFIMKPEL